ncbi:MAG: heme NO-binding domain-containing protein [Planctomycetes bacterium]|nr:heme NO-binding domain-containing protein [Planctomycetota bacterium]
MHGIIHLALRKYLQARHGPEGWQRLLEQAGASTSLGYVRVGYYPDEEFIAIVAAASSKTGAAIDAIYEDFGASVAPDLLMLYPRLVNPEWRTLDVLFNTESTIHRVVRARNKGAQPPAINCTRPSPDRVVITYTSPRKLCALARGLVRGVARHYGERVEIFESECMLRGGNACKIAVQVKD